MTNDGDEDGATWAMVTASWRTVTGISVDDVGEVVAEARLGPLGQLDEQQEGDRRRSPDDEADHVAGMAVIALAGRAVVESAIHRRRLGRGGRGVASGDRSSSCRTVPGDGGDHPQDEHRAEEQAAVAERLEQPGLPGESGARRPSRRAATPTWRGTTSRRARAGGGWRACAQSARRPRRGCCARAARRVRSG